LPDITGSGPEHRAQLWYGACAKYKVLRHTSLSKKTSKPLSVYQREPDTSDPRQFGPKTLWHWLGRSELSGHLV